MVSLRCPITRARHRPAIIAPTARSRQPACRIRLGPISTTVPKFTVVTGNSYGAGNYAMCGRAYDRA